MVNLTTKQEDILEQPLSNRIFLSGPAGTGKTTIGAQRLLKLLDSGISGNSILILTPQRTLSRTYETVLQEEDNYSGSKVNFMTIGSIARKIVDLFWPFGSEYGGFSNDDQPPVFLSLETAQYHMARIVQPLLEKGYFSMGN